MSVAGGWLRPKSLGIPLPCLWGSLVPARGYRGPLGQHCVLQASRSLTRLRFVSALEPVTEVPNSQPHGHGGPEGEYGAGRGTGGWWGAGGQLTLTSAPALADAVPARGIAALLQPRTPCLALTLLALLWI